MTSDEMLFQDAYALLDSLEYVGGMGDDHCPAPGCSASLYGGIKHSKNCRMAEVLARLRVRVSQINEVK